MLQSHFNAVEDVLLAKSKIVENAGHPVIRGTPREWFVQEFLQTHLPSSLEIGQGEIISSISGSGDLRDEQRHQLDVIAYRQSLPRISYSPTNTAFLAEGVVYSVEVKSTLEKGKYRQGKGATAWKSDGGLFSACEGSVDYKSLVPEYSTRLTRTISSDTDLISQAVIISRFQSYVVAYDSVSKISTIATWLPEIINCLECNPDDAIDLICVLGKGTIWREDSFIYPINDHEPANKWAYVEQDKNNLYTLFMHMLCLNHDPSSPSTSNYLRRYIEWAEESALEVNIV
jgi:effector-binding domain-containing protein